MDEQHIQRTSCNYLLKYGFYETSLVREKKTVLYRTYKFPVFESMLQNLGLSLYMYKEYDATLERSGHSHNHGPMIQVCP